MGRKTAGIERCEEGTYRCSLPFQFGQFHIIPAATSIVYCSDDANVSSGMETETNGLEQSGNDGVTMMMRRCMNREEHLPQQNMILNKSSGSLL